MMIVYSDQVNGWLNPPPHERTLKVLLSPNFQPITQDLGMGMVILPPGRTSSAHSHESEQEVWYVICSRGRVRIGDEEAEIRPDTAVVAPPGIAHQLHRRSPTQWNMNLNPEDPDHQSFLPDI